MKVESQPLISQNDLDTYAKHYCNRPNKACTVCPSLSAISFLILSFTLVSDPNDCASCSPVIQSFTGIFVISLTVGSIIYNCCAYKGVSSDQMEEKEREKLKCCAGCSVVSSVAASILGIIGIIFWANNCSKINCNF